MPVTRFHRPAARRTPAGSRSGSSRATRSRSIIRFFDADGLDLAEDAQRKIERLLRPGGLPPGVPRRDRRHRLPAPGARAVRRRARGDGRRRARSAPRRFKVVIDYAYGSTSFVMPNVLAKLGADVLGGQPVRLDRGGARPSTATEHAEQVADLRAGLGRRTSARCSTPTASTSRSSTTRATSSTDDQALLALLDAGLRRTSWATRVALPVAVTSHADDLAGAARRAGAADQDVDPGADGRGRRARASGSRPAPTAASSCPGFLPAFDAAATPREGARAARPHATSRCPTVVDGAARASTSPTRRS